MSLNPVTYPYKILIKLFSTKPQQALRSTKDLCYYFNVHDTSYHLLFVIIEPIITAFICVAYLLSRTILGKVYKQNYPVCQ